MKQILKMEPKVECTGDSMKLQVQDAASTPGSLFFVDRGTFSLSHGACYLQHLSIFIYLILIPLLLIIISQEVICLLFLCQSCLQAVVTP